MNKQEKRIQEKGYIFLADTYYDGQGDRRNLIGFLLRTGHYDLLWANHTLDVDVKPHTHVLWRESYSTSISAISIRYNHPARLIQCVGRDAEHTNYKGAMIYLLHIDRKSVAAGKRKYNEDCLYGPWKSKALQVISDYRKKSENNDNDIILILDWIDNHANCTTSDLVRWCCANNLYSVYRRSASIVNNILREHRDMDKYNSLVAGVGQQFDAMQQQIAFLREDRAYKRGRKEVESSYFTQESLETFRKRKSEVS